MQDNDIALCKRRYVCEYGGIEKHDKDSEQSLHKKYKPVWNKIFKKNIINKYNLKFLKGLTGEDQCFCNCYYELCKKEHGKCYAGKVNKTLHNYLIRKGFVMDDFINGKSFDKVLDSIKMPEMMYDFFSKNKLLNEKTYKTYFDSLNFGINYSLKSVGEDCAKKDRIIRLLHTAFSNKPEVKISENGFTVDDIDREFKINNPLIIQKLKEREETFRNITKTKNGFKLQRTIK